MRIWLLICLSAGSLSAATAQDDLDARPIHYLSSQPNDPVSLWSDQLKSDDSKVDDAPVQKQPEWDEKTGWLKAVLDGLAVPSESQTLVFSKTSMQLRSISPRNPRAIYFNDDVYVGYVPGGKLLELSAVDPKLGAIFYSVQQSRDGGLQIKREDHHCLACHSSAKTKGVPGYLVRSVFPASSGHPVYSFGTTTTDHSTAIKDRFGGWFISNGQSFQHRGNKYVQEESRNAKTPKWESFAAIDANESTEPTGVKINWNRYPAQSSDMVALMVLEHQTQGHNVMTAAQWDVRKALDYQQVMNEALERPADFQSDATKRRIQRAVDRITDYFLFENEAQLPARLPIDSSFCKQFQSVGPQDKQGRSLRQLDGNVRMFRYPCSFLIYTDAFNELPEVVREGVLRSIWKRLNSTDSQVGEAGIANPETREAIHEILLETVPGYSRLEKSDD